MNSPRRSFSVRILHALTATIICATSILLLAPEAMAGKGCDWEGGGWYLECSSGYWGMGTGCIGLKNVAGTDVRFLVNSGDGNNARRTLKKGRTRNADFKGGMAIHACKKKVNGKWKDMKCYDAFDRKKNTSTGGGCGCKHFKCL